MLSIVLVFINICMNYLHKMYSKHSRSEQSTMDKNPNRVAGGLKAQGVDTLTLLGEDGFEKEIPSKKYVQTLEEQVKKQRAAIDVLERKISRQESALEHINAKLSRL
jgi:thiamine kinase-like enzyme